MAKLERHITGMTPEGEQKLAENEALREAVERYLGAKRPEMIVPPGGRLLAAGKYSFAFLVEGVILKISSSTSSREAFVTKRPAKPENLEDQFKVLSKLGEHLRSNEEGVCAPDQFFVAYSPSGAYILGQEFLDGWITLEGRTNEVYGYPSMITEEQRREMNGHIAVMRSRVIRSLAGFSMQASINDLVQHDKGIHGGNVLVPRGVELDGDTWLAIIDQPGGKSR